MPPLDSLTDQGCMSGLGNVSMVEVSFILASLTGLGNVWTRTGLVSRCHMRAALLWAGHFIQHNESRQRMVQVSDAHTLDQSQPRTDWRWTNGRAGGGPLRNSRRG